MEIINLFANNIALMNNVLLFAFFIVFGIVFWREHKNSASPLSWTDMLIDNKTNKLSLTKLGQFWGISMSTWITIYMTQKLTSEQISTMFPMVFGTWLTFLVASQSIKAYTMTKEKTDVEMKKDGE